MIEQRTVAAAAAFADEIGKPGCPRQAHSPKSNPRTEIRGFDALVTQGAPTSARRPIALSLSLGPLAQPRDQHRHTENQESNRRDSSGGASGQPHAEDERGKQERKQRGESDYVMGNTVGIAIDVFRRFHAAFFSDGCEVLLCYGHDPR